MLELKDIRKDYGTDSDNLVAALKGINIKFRECEFVSILGPSGCGKTTLLNIIGGLDHYTSGDLIINNVSTKEYKDRDWDTYRNHSIGFVFQSYNLIPHQTVLRNVELALTLSGVNKEERRAKAEEALKKVGLGDQLNKKPNQMSGGQMQRVAIARALVNNPDILLADEPTGALDTETSVQIMDLLKEVAKDRLVIMVTHNPDLAEQYSTRIIRLLDGQVKGDTNPVTEDLTSKIKAIGKRTSMKWGTALSLSFNNLLTKKGRTFITAFAGSIGIIGISMILSLSNGVQLYINHVQEDTLSSYPLTINTEAMDFNSMMGNLAENTEGTVVEKTLDRIYSSDIMGKLVNSWMSGVTSNNLKKFKQYLDTNEEMQKYTSDIQYNYNVTLHVYTFEEDGDLVRVNPSSIFEEMFNSETITDAITKIEDEGGEMNENLGQGLSMMSGGSESTMGSLSSMGMSSGTDVWREILDDEELVHSQYDVVAGKWPEAFNEIVLVVDEKNRVSDFTLYALGLREHDDLSDATYKLLKGDELTTDPLEFSYEEILNLKYTLIFETDYYGYNEETECWEERTKDKEYLEEMVEKAKTDSKYGTELKVVGIVRPNEDAVSLSLGTNVIGYRSDLTKYAIEGINNSEIVAAQKADETMDIFTNLPFVTDELKNVDDKTKAENFKKYILEEADVREKADIYMDFVTEPDAAEVQAKTEAMVAEKIGTGTVEELLAALGALAVEYPDATIPNEDGTETKLSDMMAMMSQMPPEMIAAQAKPEDLMQLVSAVCYQGVFAEEQNKIKNAATEYTTSDLAETLETRVKDYFTQEDLVAMYDKYMPAQYSEANYDDNISKLHTVDMDVPTSINIYCKTFEDKDEVTRLIKEYNKAADEDDKITYTDLVALIMSSVSTIINAISYILIAFVAISLVVSSIMIGIITYISVLERTKEIGILRAIGASKKDIARVFNAETILIGLTSGLIGVGFTWVCLFPINIIIKNLTDISHLAQMPYVGAIILVVISMGLTFIAGLFPSSVAAKKDPVVALRTE